jgi:uncharacterized protein YdaU (DUF1376 family)
VHYYKRNIGDYAKKAGRLSMLEHGAYTLLIDACYDRERFPTEAEAIEWCWARSPEEIQAVTFVLNRFFELVDGRWVQNRISEEVAKYHHNAQINSRIATEREAKRTNRASTVDGACTVVHEPPPNQEPRTKNHKPITSNQVKGKTVSAAPPLPDGVDEQVWVDWLALRKAKKAPVTDTVLKGAMTEAEKAGMTLNNFLLIWCQRGSQGLQAEWLKPASLKYQNATKPKTYHAINEMNYEEGVTEDGTF